MTERKYTDSFHELFEKVGPIVLPLAIDNSKTTKFKLTLYRITDRYYHVIVSGNIDITDLVFLRIESACTFAHLYGSKLCDCEEQLRTALRIISDKGGILIYALDQHGRGVGLINHVRVYQEEQKGLDTIEAHKNLGLQVDARNYSDILKILTDMKISKIKLLTNNPARTDFFKSHLEQVERVPIEHPLNPYNVRELMIKKEKMGHIYSFMSDRDWLFEIYKSSERPPDFAIVENSSLVIFKGNLNGIVNHIGNMPENNQYFYTIYCSEEMSHYENIHALLSIININNEHLTVHNLRVIGNSDVSEEKLKQLYKFAIDIGILELKYIRYRGHDSP